MPRPFPSFLTAVSLLLATVLAAPLAYGHGSASDHPHDPTMNQHVISEALVTGGHFVNDGLQILADDGVTVVIDLRDEPPEGQAEKLAAAGVKWVSVPVSWKNPRPEDYEAFASAMKAHADEKILVQCQANYRASAMTFLYRANELGVSERKARKDLNAVWQPGGTWGDYIEAMLD